MSEKIQFVSNYSDLSTDKGFQFEFFCDRCGTGYRTRFAGTATGALTDILDTAGSLFGGLFGQAAEVDSVCIRQVGRKPMMTPLQRRSMS